MNQIPVSCKDIEWLRPAEFASSMGPYVLWTLHHPRPEQDVVDAVASFIAAYMLEQPESRGMSPEKLQAALALTFKELRKGRMQSLWAWGRTLYRYGAVGYGAYGLYSNPWVARASLQALWACAKVICSAGAGLVIL